MARSGPATGVTTTPTSLRAAQQGPEAVGRQAARLRWRCWRPAAAASDAQPLFAMGSVSPGRSAAVGGAARRREGRAS